MSSHTPRNMHFVYFVGQAGQLVVKGGCMAARDPALAHEVLTRRYATYYSDLLVYGIVPVGSHKRKAEKELFELAAQFHLHSEFFHFEDRMLLVNCVHQFLETLRVPEDAAFTSLATSSTAADREARKAERRVLEHEMADRHRQQVEAKRRKLDNMARSVAKLERGTASISQKVHDQKSILAWMDRHLTLGGDDDFVTRKQLEAAIRAAGFHAASRQLKRDVGSRYSAAGVYCKEQHCHNGVRYLSAWMKLSLQ